MANNNKTENKENYITQDRDKFHLGFYDKKGYLNNSLLIKTFFLYQIIIFPIIVYIVGVIFYLFEDGNTIIKYLTSEKLEFLILEAKYFWRSTLEIISGNIIFEKVKLFVFVTLISEIITMILYLKFKSIVKKKAKMQSNISSIGLSSYYLYKKVAYNIFIFKLIKGETMSFDTFEQRKEDLCQLFAFNTAEIKRIEQDKVEVHFSMKFPKIGDREVTELNNNLDKYQKKGHMLLGYSNISDENIVEERVNNLYIKYLSLKELNIHMKVIGKSGFGKSVIFGTQLDNFMKNLQEIDTLFVHDFKGIEDVRMNEFIMTSKQKEELEKRIITSSKIQELEDILIKLKIVYEYRKIIMNKNNWTNYQGNKIILMIDEYNIGMKQMDSNDKFVRRRALETERMLIEVSMLYRAMGIYLIITGQSNLVKDSWDSTINAQTSIGFCLNVKEDVAMDFCEDAYKKDLNSSKFPKGEVLFYDAGNSRYFKYLSAYKKDNFLDDIGKLNIVERKKIDNDMFKLAIQLKEKLHKEQMELYDDLLKEEEIDQKEYDKMVINFTEKLSSNINEISEYKFLTKKVDTFEFEDPEKFSEKGNQALSNLINGKKEEKEQKEESDYEVNISEDLEELILNKQNEIEEKEIKEIEEKHINLEKEITKSEEEVKEEYSNFNEEDLEVLENEINNDTEEESEEEEKFDRLEELFNKQMEDENNDNQAFQVSEEDLKELEEF